MVPKPDSQVGAASVIEVRMGHFSAMSAAALCLLYSNMAAASLKTAATPASPLAEPPMVLSYAVQPVSHFNQALAKAQRQQAAWSQDPRQISRQYSGQGFQLVDAKQYKGQMITYSIKAPHPGHPQMLLILSLGKQQGHWALDKACLSWRCASDDFFGTNHCKTVPVPR
ncbi:hypothetical protein [Shewanella sp. YIC-542]|uniref:hypothetical protein n=1 Tax=Shewanella mytili TaxID=3377111 RepID=UPI00398F5B81